MLVENENTSEGGRCVVGSRRVFEIVSANIFKPRRLFSIVAHHLIGQPKFRNPNSKVTGVLQGMLFGNRLAPLFGNYAFFGQDQIDAQIEFWWSSIRQSGACPSFGFFVEIGSNDGIAFSNCKHFELFHNFSGILVEPFLPNLELSKLNRKGPNFVHAAVVPLGYGKSTVELEFSNLMTTMSLGADSAQAASDFADQGQNFLYANQIRHRFSAPALNLQAVLTECDAPKHICILSIDIEGHELAVLEDFDFSEYFIDLIIVESFNQVETISFFLERGFALVEELNGHNLLFVNRNLLKHTQPPLTISSQAVVRGCRPWRALGGD